VCQECLVTIDRMPNRRACLEPARDGIDVRRQAFPGEPPGASRGTPPIGFADLAVERADVVVIGGGAGGLAAAVAARGCGLDVLLLDERSTAGGQYFKQPAAALREPALDRQQADGAALRTRAERAGVRVLDRAEVVTALDAGAVLVTRAGRAFVARGRALVVATGAYERGVPMPGWTLPGVMTTGALQTLWRSYRALPGRRILIAGNGPLNLQVACETIDAGASVVAVAGTGGVVAHVLDRAFGGFGLVEEDEIGVAADFAVFLDEEGAGIEVEAGTVGRAGIPTETDQDVGESGCGFGE
jgi:NADPH-dependent 2,4-dienoyl-CoA reductase/sulfur reductase-like enzyme